MYYPFHKTYSGSHLPIISLSSAVTYDIMHCVVSHKVICFLIDVELFKTKHLCHNQKLLSFCWLFLFVLLLWQKHILYTTTISNYLLTCVGA